MSDETIRTTLKALDVNWKRAKHWIASSDPHYAHKKKHQEHLIEEAKTRGDWAVGFQDEAWWSRLTHPNLYSWSADIPLRRSNKRMKKMILIRKPCLLWYRFALLEVRRSLHPFCGRQSQKRPHNRLHEVDAREDRRERCPGITDVRGSCFLAQEQESSLMASSTQSGSPADGRRNEAFSCPFTKEKPLA